MGYIELNRASFTILIFAFKLRIYAKLVAQLAGAVEYTDCFSAEG